MFKLKIIFCPFKKAFDYLCFELSKVNNIIPKKDKKIVKI